MISMDRKQDLTLRIALWIRNLSPRQWSSGPELFIAAVVFKNRQVTNGHLPFLGGAFPNRSQVLGINKGPRKLFFQQRPAILRRTMGRQSSQHTGEAAKHARGVFVRLFGNADLCGNLGVDEPAASAEEHMGVETPIVTTPVVTPAPDVIDVDHNWQDEDDTNSAFPRKWHGSSGGSYNSSRVTSNSLKVPMELRDFNIFFGKHGELILPRKPRNPGWFSYWSASFIDSLPTPECERLPWLRPDPRLRANTRSDFEQFMRMFERLELEHFEIAVRWLVTQHHRLLFDGTDMNSVLKPGMQCFFGVAERMVLESDLINKDSRQLVSRLHDQCEQAEQDNEDLKKRCISLEAELKATKRRNLRYKDALEDLQLKYHAVLNSNVPPNGGVLPMSAITENRLEFLRSHGMSVEGRINMYTQETHYTITVAASMLPLLVKDLEERIR